MGYLWIKAFHIIFIITWFAGIFYLPRLFVYHAGADDKASNDRFKIMERKLYRGIMTPSMVLSIVFGTQSRPNGGILMEGVWFHTKMTLVAAVIGYHFWCGSILKQFLDDKNERSHVWFRWFNEVPVVALIAIVILVVVKPF